MAVLGISKWRAFLGVFSEAIPAVGTLAEEIKRAHPLGVMVAPPEFHAVPRARMAGGLALASRAYLGDVWVAFAARPPATEPNQTLDTKTMTGLWCAGGFRRREIIGFRSHVFVSPFLFGKVILWRIR